MPEKVRLVEIPDAGKCEKEETKMPIRDDGLEWIDWNEIFNAWYDRGKRSNIGEYGKFCASKKGEKKNKKRENDTGEKRRTTPDARESAAG